MTINIPTQVKQTITNGVTTYAPSEDAVFDALALKLDTSAFTSTAVTAKLLTGGVFTGAFLSATDTLLQAFVTIDAVMNDVDINGVRYDDIVPVGKIMVGGGTLAQFSTFSLNATGGTFGISASGSLTMPNATTAIRGLLTAADWNTFNNKGSGTVTSVTSANADATVATTTTTPVVTIVQTPALRSATTTVNVSSATAPTIGQVLTATGASAATWQTPSGGDLTIGTTTIASGTTTRVLYDNAGVVGEYTISGTGSVAMTTSPTFTTDLTTPKIIGGTGVTSKITNIGSTNATPTAGIAHEWLIGNNGTTVGMSLYHSNQLLLGTTTAPLGALAIPLRIGSGTNTIDIGSYSGTYSSIWFNQATPSTSNFGFLGNSSTTYLNATSNLYWTIGGAQKMTIGSSYIELDLPTIIGGATASAMLHVIKTTEQLRLGYDTSNYFSVTIASTGDATLDLTGTSPTFMFNKSINMASGKNIVTNTTTGTIVASGASQKLGFWGATAVIQQKSAAEALVATTAATNVTPYGYTTAAQADGIITLLNEIRNVLVTTGIMKGSA